MKHKFVKKHAPEEPPGVILADIAFNLLIFFVVLASTDPESGRKQVIPRSESNQQQQQQAQNVEIVLTRETVSINGTPTSAADFPSKLKAMLAGKANPEDRVVVMKSDKAVSYERWIQITGEIEAAGGVITLQLEETQTVGVQ